uniref:Uncharacterized protein n=4 Tax=Triticinae TaxID=1648030 RepID=A0A8R7QMC0_TRIUA
MLLENYADYARHARLYTSIHALKPKTKPKSGTISESTSVNVDQSSTTNLCEIAPSAPMALCATAATKVPGSNSLDQNAPAEPTVGPSTALPKKEGPVATKGPADKKKMDARKKSLKRL